VPNVNGDASAAYMDAARAAGQECLEAALRNLERGWSPLAICPPDHLGVGKSHGNSCKSPGKAPWGPWKEFQTRRPTESELRQRWRDNPFLNVGVALGPISRLIRVDVDGGQGEQFLHELSRGDLPDTLEMQSGGGGRGLLYCIPEGVTVRPTHQHGDKVHEGLSLLGEGAQTVLPPSRHVSGRRYAWTPGHGLDDLKPAPAPDWLVKLMSKEKATGPKPSPIGNTIGDGNRNLTLTSLAGTMRRRGMSQEAILAALQVVNEQQCDPPLSESEVEKIAASVARYDPAPPSGTPSSSSDRRRPAADIIRDFILAEYDPTYRVGSMIRSHTRGMLLKRSDVIAGAPGPLIDQLLGAIEVNRDENGNPLRKSLPKVYRDWAPTAYADVLAGLPEEEDSAEVESSAAVEFRRKVASALFAQVTLGEEKKNKEGEVIAQFQVRRSLIDWCAAFAKPGGWQSIRSYLIWVAGGAAGSMRIALRVGLFGQVGPRDLAECSQYKFGQLCEMYAVGAAQRACGQRVVELTPEFIASLRVRPAADEPSREPGQKG
jgi:hypothetical protein